MAGAPGAAAWGRHRAAPWPSSHCSTACLQLLQWEISSHYHTFREIKHSSAPATSFFFLQLWRPMSQLMKGLHSAAHVPARSYQIWCTVCRGTAAVSKSLSTCTHSCARASFGCNHKKRYIMLSPIFHTQVVRQKLSQSIMVVFGNMQSHKQKWCLPSPSAASGSNQIYAMQKLLQGFTPLLPKISPLTFSKEIQAFQMHK